jgi:regulator of sirC expression with transglutaminase-like and TPR domain
VLQAAVSAEAEVTDPVALAMPDPVTAVEAVLAPPEAELDYARAKLAFDRIIDPTVDAKVVLAELDRMADAARELAGPAPDDAAKLSALRRLIYNGGPWNGSRPFEYDHSDPFGPNRCNSLLSSYLATKRGNCVSMPILFLILAQRFGLNVALATAPEHVFVRCTIAGGRTLNLETTSGAHPARDEWYQQNFRISKRAIETGLYLRTLTKREGTVVMAAVVIEWLHEQRRFEEVIALCKALLEHHPRDSHIILSQGSAYGKLLEQFRRKYPVPGTAPPAQAVCAFTCMERNISLFAAAERLGWAPFEDDAEEPADRSHE